MHNKLFATLCLLLAFSCTRAAERPNVILILADDLGWGDLGSQGQKLVATPHLDRMAAEGLRLTRFYAGSTVCAPSRSVLMTGQHTGHTRVRGNAGKGNRLAQCLREGDATLASVLKSAGYATALVGKWGLGQEGGPGLPTRHGFDHFYGYLDQTHAHNPYPPFLIRGEGREPLRNLPHPDVPPAMWEMGAGWSANRADYAPDLLAAEAVRWVEANREKPFFLYWSLITPHANNEATRGTGDGQEVPDHGDYAGKDWPAPDKGFAASVTRLDADVGRLLDRLKELGLDRNTLVIFTSDNGPHAEGGHRPDFFDTNGPLRGIKRSLTEGGIRVPGIFRWPGRIPAGGVSAQPAWFPDLLPTLAAFAGVTPDRLPAGLDGIDISTLLTDAKATLPVRDFYWEFHEGGFRSAVILEGRYKVISAKAGSDLPEVFDLETDIGEEHNLATTRAELVEHGRAAFTKMREDSPDWPVAR